MIKEITCIQCPVGCPVTVEHENGVIKDIKGHQCAKGKTYAKEEFFCSKRVLTTTVFCQTKTGLIPVPVKTNGEIPLDLLYRAVRELRKKTYQAPIKSQDILYKNLLDTGVDVIATHDAC